MAKRIVICCDGTGNEINDHHSNVLKYCRVLKKSSQQIVYYDPGLGTLGADSEWARLKQDVEKVAGLALGYGLDRNVLNAYLFLVERYDEGDDVYLIGFSRGAYTARVLAGFINAIGILRPEQANLASYALVAYKQIGDDRNFEAIRLFEKSLRPRHPAIRFLGLWDTVSSIIVPRADRFFVPSLRQLAFTDSNPSVERVRHALAVDERRRMFRPYLWRENESYWGNPFRSGNPAPQDVKQVWFAGVHADIGGGYEESNSGLSKLTLQWMIEESPDELEFVTQTYNQVVLGKQRANSPHSYAGPDPLAKRHESLTFAWWPLEWIPKRAARREWRDRRALLGLYLPRAEPRHIPQDATIHPSVVDRQKQDESYRPPNLPTNDR